MLQPNLTPQAMIGVGIEKRDSAIIRNAGFLFRSIASKAWEDRSVVLRQIDEIGLRSIKVSLHESKMFAHDTQYI